MCALRALYMTRPRPDLYRAAKAKAMEALDKEED